MTNLRKSDTAWQRVQRGRVARLTAGGFANRTDARKRGARKVSK